MSQYTIFGFLILAIFMVHAKQHNSIKGIPTISLEDLKTVVRNPSASAIIDLKDGGGKISALVIDGLGDGYDKAMKNLITNGPKCMSHLKESEIISLPMTDESNRMTYATMDGKFPDCFGLQPLSEAFDEIDSAISSVLSMARKEARPSADFPMTYDTDGKQLSINEALKKEHIHVYDRSVSTSSYTVPFHIDNGLYLILTSFPGHGLRIKTSDNKVVPLDNLELGSAIVLFGRGVTEWLLQEDHQTKQMFYAAPHAVPTVVDGSVPRTVYARMKVVQTSATPISRVGREGASQLKTFGEVFMETGVSNSLNSDYNDLCPKKDSLKENETWLAILKDQCDEGFAFCWHSCLPLPDECPHEEDAFCHNDTNEPCFDDSMDVTCHWDCK